jgi:hypothetical protein
VWTGPCEGRWPALRALRVAHPRSGGSLQSQSVTHLEYARLPMSTAQGPIPRSIRTIVALDAQEGVFGTTTGELRDSHASQ